MAQPDPLKWIASKAFALPGDRRNRDPSANEPEGQTACPSYNDSEDTLFNDVIHGEHARVEEAVVAEPPLAGDVPPPAFEAAQNANQEANFRELELFNFFLHSLSKRPLPPSALKD